MLCFIRLLYYTLDLGLLATTSLFMACFYCFKGLAVHSMNKLIIYTSTCERLLKEMHVFRRMPLIRNQRRFDRKPDRM